MAVLKAEEAEPTGLLTLETAEEAFSLGVVSEVAEASTGEVAAEALEAVEGSRVVVEMHVSAVEVEEVMGDRTRDGVSVRALQMEL